MIRPMFVFCWVLLLASSASAEQVYQDFVNQLPDFQGFPSAPTDLPTVPLPPRGDDGRFTPPGIDEPLQPYKLGSPEEFCNKFPQYPLCPKTK